MNECLECGEEFGLEHFWCPNCRSENFNSREEMEPYPDEDEDDEF